MICNILKEKEKWLELKSDSYEALIKRQVKVKFLQIEEALSFWVEKTIENNITINGELLAQKANDFVILLNKIDFKESEGWVVDFKKRHKLECYLKYGELVSTPIETLDDMHKNLQNILADYSSNDIFNADETGLYWKMKSNHILSNGPGKYI